MIADDAHRPWPRPRSPWVLFMRWNRLAFLHWPVSPGRVRDLLPEGLELDTFEGEAWIGITPLGMSHVRARLTPAIPGASSFPELNVRTYVSAEGKPGVWFFSLDAANRLAVHTARWSYGLPYHHADMSMEADLCLRADLSERASTATPGWSESVAYRSVRRGRTHGAVRFAGTYRPTGKMDHAAPGSLAHWLIERYCLYTLTAGRLCRAEIDHEPWPLQPGTVEIESNSMTAPIGIDLPRAPALVHIAPRLDVVAWLPMPVR